MWFHLRRGNSMNLEDVANLRYNRVREWPRASIDEARYSRSRFDVTYIMVDDDISYATVALHSTMNQLHLCKRKKIYLLKQKQKERKKTTRQRRWESVWIWLSNETLLVFSLSIRNYQTYSAMK